jgi:Carboxypeptidase regulatory-like domain
VSKNAENFPFSATGDARVVHSLGYTKVEGKRMRIRNILLASTAATAAVLFQFDIATPVLAQSVAPLAGQVSSVAEPAMEGVVVSAKKDGSTITISVVTDKQGRYKFPAERLEPGHYTLGARAAGYDTTDRGPPTWRPVRRPPPT